MIRNIIKLGQIFAGKPCLNPVYKQIPRISTSLLSTQQLNGGLVLNAKRWPSVIETPGHDTRLDLTILRSFHAARSKVHYLDFRYRLPTNVTRTHLLIIRRKKMKKHRRRKWRRRFRSILAKTKFKRELTKEKMFRVELLSLIRNAEEFDPREFAMKKIHELNNKPKEMTREERFEHLKQLVRENRYEVDYVKPKHRKLDE